MKLRHIIATFTAIAMIALALPAGADDSHGYTAKQIFEGVFFGRGPIAQRIPEIWDSSSLVSYRGTVHSPRFSKTINVLERKIAKHDPTYFTQLQSDMTSGDPGLVQQAVQLTHREVAAVMPNNVTHAGVHPWAESQSKDGDAEDTVVILVLVVVVALALIVPETSGGCTGIQCPNVNQGFADDRVAALIATRLRT